jgi:hypothetical protein
MRSTTLALASVMFAACAADVEPPTGQVEVALVGTADDGSHYRLIAGTRLVVSGDGFFETFSLDGDATTVAIDLPVGEYQVGLTHQFGYTDEWPLTRIDADGTETGGIVGTLLTVLPVNVAITEDKPTPLPLSFRVAVSGTITFASGTLAVSADVAVVEANGARLTFNAEPVTIAGATIQDGAPESLDAYWPVEGTSGLFAVVEGDLVKWTLRSTTRVCSPITLDAAGGTPDTSFFDLVLESIASPTPAEACIYWAGDKQYIEVRMTRLGSAFTPELNFDQTQYLFVTRLAAELPEPVFVDGTLSLGLLDGTLLSLPFAGDISVEEVTPANEFVPWFNASLTGTASVGHQPTYAVPVP